MHIPKFKLHTTSTLEIVRRRSKNMHSKTYLHFNNFWFYFYITFCLKKVQILYLKSLLILISLILSFKKEILCTKINYILLFMNKTNSYKVLFCCTLKQLSFFPKTPVEFTFFCSISFFLHPFFYEFWHDIYITVWPIELFL